MDWDSLKVVLAIGRGGGISAAARTLGMDPATVSRRLSAVEAAMGAILFVRSRHGLTPTPAGDLAIEEAGRMERRLDALGARLRHLSGTPTGVVRVASNPWIISEVLAPATPRLTADYPEIRLRLIAANAGLSLSRREVDVALWFEISPAQSEFAIPVGEVRYAVYQPKGKAAENLRWATFWDDQAARAPMRWLKEMGAREEDILVGANDAHAVRAAIRAGGCKGAIPTLLGDGDPALARLDPDAPDRVRDLHAIVHPDTANSAEIVVVLDWVRKELAGG